MSILASDVITVRVRPLLGATLDAQYASNTAPLAFLSDAVRLLYAGRPDAAIDDDGNYNDFATVTAIDQSIPISEKWLPYLTDYVLGRFFSLDAENQGHAERAAKHFADAKEGMTV